MIVIGVDVHKHELTAVAVDELGRELSGWSGPLEAGLLRWARSLAGELLWALEDCRHVSRGLERLLLEAGEPLVRVPPRLTAPARRRGRSRGKSDRIDALAIARAALREPYLDRPRPQEASLRELKLLLDHRDDLVAERRRVKFCRPRPSVPTTKISPRGMGGRAASLPPANRTSRASTAISPRMPKRKSRPVTKLCSRVAAVTTE